MNRKEFLLQCGKYCAAGMSLPALLSSCVAVTYAPFSIQGNRMVVKKSDMAEHPFVVLRTDNLPAPVYLAQLEDQSYVALLMECTHKQCEVRPFATLLQCPCHGSEYSNTGEVLEGPAERNLHRFEVITDNENIYIQ